MAAASRYILGRQLFLYPPVQVISGEPHQHSATGSVTGACLYPKTPAAAIGISACGVAHFRVRRLQSPQPAFAIPPQGVWKPVAEHTILLPSKSKEMSSKIQSFLLQNASGYWQECIKIWRHKTKKGTIYLRYLKDNC
ncbi:MAG: hypothetical protein IJK51_10635 [Bacteroidaceae bacterium]|nr:hypothetical protein [Bacteroidaceae bacterium]